MKTGPGAGVSPGPGEVRIPLGTAVHPGLVRLPAASKGLVLFAHGSGSSRLSRRNNQVADFLAGAGIASLLFDLLTPEEDQDYATRFDIALLSDRMIATLSWVERQPELGNLGLGLFGASTGAAAALTAAASPKSRVAAVVSRGGRPDLAGPALPNVRCPTLLIVGGADDQVIELNRMARERLRCPSELAIVPGATHLFEEPGALESVARLAADWFLAFL